jgi:hypothetical protein
MPFCSAAHALFFVFAVALLRRGNLLALAPSFLDLKFHAFTLLRSLLFALRLSLLVFALVLSLRALESKERTARRGKPG